MEAIVRLIQHLLNLYVYVLIASAIMSWLIAFDVVNIRNRVVRAIWDTLTAVTEPVLAPIRRRMPQMGGLDLSPVIVIIGIWFIQMVIDLYVLRNVRGY
ncbi:MAG: hypothetical protein JWL93_443 [Hyphomicrobiales bacterium]|jgi:YggT family protein|nr:hypothetical protein [Hyphomicrobiales bacterium]